jgi:putative MATE family efflux protein
MNPAPTPPDSWLAQQGTLRPMLRLALPVLAEESLTILVGYTDWWLAGHFLGTTAHQAAMGLMAYVMWLIPSLFSAVAIGATALVARFVGAGDRPAAARVANQALLIGTGLAAVATVVAWFAGPAFIRAMRLETEAAALAGSYLAIVVPAIPLVMIEQVAAACLRGAGDTISGFAAKSLVNVVNMTLSALLLLGPGPIPKLGWEGLAVGTACGHTVGGLLLLVLLLAGRAGLRVGPATLRPDRALIRRVLRIGLPGGIDVLSVLTCQLIYVSIINSLGTLSAAAHGLGLQIEALAYLPGAAFSVAATTLSGQCLGAGQPERATRSVLLTCLVAFCVMSGAAVVFATSGHRLTTFFTGDPANAAGVVTAQLLKIVAVSTPALGVVQVLIGGLRGAGDTRVPLLITFVGLLLIRIPLACLLAWDRFELPMLGVTISAVGWGVHGAWWAMNTDVLTRALLVSLRFWHGGWRRIEV